MNVLEEIDKLHVSLSDIDALHIFVNHEEIKYDSHEDRIEKLIETLNVKEYDNGYGSQELFGLIIMKDNSWFERAEYDGSEWWEHKRQITKEDVFNFKDDE